MTQAEKTSIFQKAIEVVEALSPEQQAMLVDILQNRLRQQRREQLLQEVAQAEQEYDRGNARRGSIADILAELEA